MTSRRRLVAWWYAPTLERWVRWASEPTRSAGDALARAAALAEYAPPGRFFVDVFARQNGAWKHETRYRFGGE